MNTDQKAKHKEILELLKRIENGYFPSPSECLALEEIKNIDLDDWDWDTKPSDGSHGN